MRKIRGNEEGSTIAVVLVTLVFLMAVVLGLTNLSFDNMETHRERVSHAMALERAEGAIQRALHEARQDDLTHVPLGGGETGFESPLVDGSLGTDEFEVTLNRAFRGETIPVSIISSFHYGLGDDHVDGYLPAVSADARNSLSNPLFDYWMIRTNVDAEDGPGEHSWRLEAVYEMRKQSFPGAVYLDPQATTYFDGMEWVIDGADHTIEPEEVEDDEQYWFEMPFSGEIGMHEIPFPEAGIHSSFWYVDPETGERIKVFNDGHKASKEFKGFSIGQDEEGNGTPIVFKKGAPLDFFINCRASENNWVKDKLGVDHIDDYDHHLFGHRHFDPNTPHHKKAFGYAWDKKMKVPEGQDNKKLSQAVLKHLSLTQPDLHQAILDNYDNKAEMMEKWDCTGGDDIVELHEDLDGDGAVEDEHDVNQNGKADSWFKGKNHEDKDGDGVLETSDDYRLAQAIQDYISGVHTGEVADDANLKDDGDVVEYLDLTMGFEDLPGFMKENDWDYDDLIFTMRLHPEGDDEFTNQEPIVQERYRVERAAGRPGIMSGLLTDPHSSHTVAKDAAFGALGLNHDLRQQDQIRSVIACGGDFVDVKGVGAFEQGYADIRGVAAAFVGGSEFAFSPDSGVNTDTSNLGTKDDYQVTYIDNAGKSPVLLEGNNEGGGVMVVTGDLEMYDSFSWYGAIICMGNLTIQGSGEGVHILGAVMVEGGLDISGQSNIWYSSEAIDRTKDLDPAVSLTPVLRSWRELPVE